MPILSFTDTRAVMELAFYFSLAIGPTYLLSRSTIFEAVGRLRLHLGICGYV